MRLFVVVREGNHKTSRRDWWKERETERKKYLIQIINPRIYK